MLRVIVFRLLLVLLFLSPSIFVPVSAPQPSEYSAANPLVLEQDVEGALVSLKLKESASAKKDLKRAAELYSAQGNKRFALQALSRLQRLEESGL